MRDLLLASLLFLVPLAACDSPGASNETPLATCRNGQLDPGEVCDGPIVGANSCQSAGYERGVLVCNTACTNFDYSGCAGGVGPQPDVSGPSPDTSGGDTTGGGLSRLPAALERERPAVVILELGANDGLRGQPIMTMAANLSRLIELCQKAGA
ncbi:MAG TPA: hypothetical protein PK095_23165, partial [Myxococcota bacterium]|nr:hypothetical protein [Myxococcota bacterium]